jgi:hypothetical protein
VEARVSHPKKMEGALQHTETVTCICIFLTYTSQLGKHNGPLSSHHARLLLLPANRSTWLLQFIVLCPNGGSRERVDLYERGSRLRRRRWHFGFSANCPVMQPMPIPANLKWPPKSGGACCALPVATACATRMPINYLSAHRASGMFGVKLTVWRLR